MRTVIAIALLLSLVACETGNPIEYHNSVLNIAQCPVVEYINKSDAPSVFGFHCNETVCCEVDSGFGGGCRSATCYNKIFNNTKPYVPRYSFRTGECVETTKERDETLNIPPHRQGIVYKIENRGSSNPLVYIVEDDGTSTPTDAYWLQPCEEKRQERPYGVIQEHYEPNYNCTYSRNSVFCLGTSYSWHSVSEQKQAPTTNSYGCWKTEHKFFPELHDGFTGGQGLWCYRCANADTAGPPQQPNDWLCPD